LLWYVCPLFVDKRFFFFLNGIVITVKPTRKLLQAAGAMLPLELPVGFEPFHTTSFVEV
jgi:hypothetical protein